mgnify:CR=1 FL=1
MAFPDTAGRGDFAAGVLTILPLLVAVVVYGLLFGTLAAQKGLSPLERRYAQAYRQAFAWMFLATFVDTLAEAGCRTFIVHARIAILEGTFASAMTALAVGGLVHAAPDHPAFRR